MNQLTKHRLNITSNNFIYNRQSIILNQSIIPLLDFSDT